MKLDFGSGYNPKEGYLSCDFTDCFGLDFVFDSENYKVSCTSDLFEEIYCRNVLHHVDDLEKMFKEFFRILKKDGILVVIDANRDSYLINTIYDIIWYRYIFKRYDIEIYRKYRDFVPIAESVGFKLVEQTIENEKLIIHLKKLIL